VIALGTNRVVGAVATAWRIDAPFVAPDGGIAVIQGADMNIVDGETLKPVSRVRGGSADYWYPFRWTGFRPRAAALDQPVEFEGVSDSTVQDSVPAADSTVRPPASTPPAADSAPRRAAGWTVSFAALLAPEKARELAAQIRVGGETARVITAVRDGATIYRVVLGPYATREDAERVGRESRNSYWVYEGGP
jgi:septal ring-binding cell division protein DamX